MSAGITNAPSAPQRPQFPNGEKNRREVSDSPLGPSEPSIEERSSVRMASLSVFIQAEIDICLRKAEDLEEKMGKGDKLPFGLSRSGLVAAGIFACYMLTPLLSAGIVIANQSRDMDGGTYKAEIIEAVLVALSFFAGLAMTKLNERRGASKQAKEALRKVKEDLVRLRALKKAAERAEGHLLMDKEPNFSTVAGVHTDRTHHK